MEAFSLLKYWKSSGGGGSGGGGGGNSKLSATTTPTTVLTSFNHDDSDNDGGDDDDDGPFFDLEFPVNSTVAGDLQVEDERQKIESESVENELFFNGIDSSESAPLTEIEEILSSATADKSLTLPVSLMKSATKLRVLMLGLKRSKSENCQDSKTTKSSSKFMTVRLKMEEMKMPKMSILTRTPSNVVKNTEVQDEKLVGAISDESNNEEKKSSSTNNNNTKKERYLKMVRPLYVKVPKKSDCGNVEENNVEVKRGKTRLNLKVMAKKHLGKSKSAVVHSMPRSSGGGGSSSKSTSSSKKIDDSLLQQQDGIQSAILHCKRSFNSSSSSEDGEDTMSVLMRSASDPSYEKKFTIETAEVVVEEHE